jgi:DNA-binding winged helix-turn-helix (wHTH) protein
MFEIYTRRETILSELLPDYCPGKRNTPAPEKTTHPPKIALTPEREIPNEVRKNINDGDFDVILDMTTNSLRFRKDPLKHTELKVSKRDKTGGHRMRFLAYMLEHPGQPFHCGNIYKVYGSSEEKKEPNTFTKTIAALRNAFEQKDTSGPYIIKQLDWDGITRSKRGYVYKINPTWRYMVIRHKDKNSE